MLTVEDRYVFNRDQTAFNKFINEGQEALDQFFGISELNHHRAVGRQPEHILAMKMISAPKTHRAFEDRRTGQTEFLGFQDNRLTKRPRSDMIMFANQDAKAFGVFNKLHY